MVAGVGQLLEADQLPRLQRLPAGDAADQAVALVQRRQRRARRRRHRRLGGALDDRRQGAVDVGQDRRLRRLGAQRPEPLLPGISPRLGFGMHRI